MFQRWKLILTNWINCYFSKSTEHKQNLNVESLVTIISHLRENLNLDESKSSILEAHTVEEFLCEKYPDFKFEDGKVEASNEEEICFSASLLLFFVCVNSKNFDIKNAMCSKLSAEDQETILKFSKSLMECPIITVGTVQAAITEACGQDIAAMEIPRATVDETPPALRSLHCTVRRLQAALDAEKFDRNYLQDELIRTNDRLERLLKEKEQHKLEILNLKAKISLCCGAEAFTKSAEAAADVSAKLTRNLQQLELKLDEVRAKLEEAEYERDVYKSKVIELKNDRDKWLTLSHQEDATIAKLSEELETERRQNQSLKHLVEELQQHNKLNGMDCSVECDELDTSIRSLQQNSTICSEACANVVEVQLGEEKEKVVALQQQIQTLHVQISELNQIREADKTTLKNVISQKESEICNLKHRINEEIEKKNDLKAYFDNEKTKLNNEINELEQQLKENHQYLNAIIEKKLEEIKTLQEEKLSLAHSLSNEKTKLENIIKELQSELDTEKQSRSRMKEGYENHIMKLNEKVLNRNNELVELQNNIFEKGETIETLRLQLRNEKEEYSKLITQYEGLNEHTNIIQIEFKKERAAMKDLEHQYNILNEEKNALEIDVEKINKALKEFMTKFGKVSDEKDAIETQLAKEQAAFNNLNKQYSDINEQYNIAQTDLKKVKDAGKKLQNKYHTLHEHHKELKIELFKEKEKFDDLVNKNQILNKDNETLQIELNHVKEDLNDIHKKYDDVTAQTKLIEHNLEKAKEMIIEFENKFLQLEQEKDAIQTGFQNLNLAFEQLKIENENIEKQNRVIQNELEEVNAAYKDLLNKYQEGTKQYNTMESELKRQKESFEKLLHEYRNLDDHRYRIENDLRVKCEEEKNLKLDLENKVRSLEEKLTESENLTDKLKKNYECQIENMNIMVTKLSNVLKDKTLELEVVKRDKDGLQEIIGDNCKVIKNLEKELKIEKQNIEKYMFEFEAERQILKNMVTVTESVLEDTKLALANKISEHLKAKDSLEYEKNQLKAFFNDLNMKYQATESANTSLMSLLRIGKKHKEDVEMESEYVREYLGQVIKSFNNEKDTNATLVRNLEAKNQSLVENNDKLKKDVNEFTVSINFLETELESRVSKLEELSKEKSQLEKSLAETSEKLEIVQREVQELEGKIANITDQNNSLKLKEQEDLAIIEDLRVTMSVLENELQIKIDKLNNALVQKTLAESDLQSVSDKLKDALEEKSQLENNIQNKIQNLNDAQLEIKHLKEKNDVLSDENNNLKLEENESIAKINQLEDAISALEQEFENKLEILSLEKIQLEKELHTITEQSMKTTVEKNKVENALKEQMQEVATVQTEKKDLEKKIAMLEDENNNLKSKNCDTVKRLKEYGIKESELEENLETCQYLINNYKVALKAVENELMTRKDQTAKDLEEITQKLDSLQHEFDQSKTKISDLTDENNNLKQQKDSVLTELEEFKAKVEDLQKVQEENEELKVAMSVLKNDIQTKEDALKALLQDKSRVDNELQKYAVQLQEALEIKSQSEKLVKEKTQKLALVQNEVDKVRNEVISLLNDKRFDSENEELSAIIGHLETKIKEKESVENDNNELRAIVSALETELQSKTEKLQSVTKEKTEIENTLQMHKDQFTKLFDEKTQLEKTLEDKSTQEKSHSDMITKLTNYLKEKTSELESLRKDKDILQQTVGDSCKVIKSLEDNLKAEKQAIDKLTSDFESERQMFKNMVSATESIMEDTKLGLNNEISQQLIAYSCLELKNKELQAILRDLEMKLKAEEMVNDSLHSLLKLERNLKQDVEKESEVVRDYLDEVISYLSKERNTNISVISAMEFQEKVLAGDYEKMKNDLESVQTINQELKNAIKALENELQFRDEKLQKVVNDKHNVEDKLKVQEDQLAELSEAKSQIEVVLNEKMQNLIVVQLEIKELKNKMAELFNEKNNLEIERKESFAKLVEFKAMIESNELKENEELSKVKSENQQLMATIEENKTVITNLEQLIKHELEENHRLRDENAEEKLDLVNRISLLQDYQTKAENVLEERQKEITTLQKELQTLQSKVDLSEQDSKAKDSLISKMSKEKDAVISTISKELVEEKALREKLEKELQAQKSIVSDLRNNLEIRALKKENEQLIRAIGQQETLAALCQEKVTEKLWPGGHQELHDSHQVDSTSSDTHSSVESLKTITDLEKIIHDKNRTITTLQTDITYMKSLMAESETKLLDVTKELEISKGTAQQLSDQLKKIVQQKNEEIADLKKQVTKMSAAENRATQIIKVSAKYQAMILKRVAEIKSNTVLKELTNFGNTDNEVRRSLAGSITMEDLENFLETTDRHIKRCTEKQIALQKERDRLTEVNRIHESEIINLKKFLTELSVSFQTFNSVKDLYGHKLSRVISVQRTVRREILNLDGRISDCTMCKLERGYGAAMQDLAECTMNLERWVERCISRTVSVEKIKQAFVSDIDRSSLASPSFQNTGLEIQLEELEKSFQKLLEEIARAVKNEGATETQATTVMEVRAEYEDKLNRMKAKMKELFNEQMAILKNKQREEIELLERELQKTRNRMEDSKRAYESHIKELTKELWSVGEKYLVKNDEAEWLRKKQRSGSLMSLQHVHSSGIAVPQDVLSRPSDAHSLRSLPVSDNQHRKREGRGLHMSDEEGEVFDNRCLKELSTPRREQPGQRLSELKWRNSLCPPHLKSSYPAETQFATTLDEDDLKAGGSAAAAHVPRKEVGITAYKKPGPPTPSKQAGRLSATDSELRESVRAECDPHAHAHVERKTSTPARFRAFLRLNKHDSNDGTPRKRLSSIFRKK